MGEQFTDLTPENPRRLRQASGTAPDTPPGATRAHASHGNIRRFLLTCGPAAVPRPDAGADRKTGPSRRASTVTRSRIPHFYRMSPADRVRAVHERGLLSDADLARLTRGEATLDVNAADKMIENVIGVLGMPIGLGLNFLINGRDYVVPLVVEEPSIVAALSAAAKVARNCGGFGATASPPILIGQIQVIDVPDMARAMSALTAHRQEILDLANSFHPRMVARGGGAVDIEVRSYPMTTLEGEMLVLHLLVDTRDAMGANLVNGMCEGVASLVESLTEGQVFLRILSNLADRALARAEVTLPPAALAGKGYAGERVRDGIIVASDFAIVDPYRAATHNKGIMNGVDAVALATGNDWRAIEAGAHAYAARQGRYSSLSQWWKDDQGNLRGRLEMPMKVGIVGGPLESNPGVAMNMRLLGAKTAQELAEVMAAVGLAQNFAALRALATEGIQTGHMTLHARSVVKAAGTPPELFDEVLERVLRDGEIKVWKAQELLEQVRGERQGAPATVARAGADAELGVGWGKAILLGEHAVVYGRHAIAVPLPLTTRAVVEDAGRGVELLIPRWGVEYQLAKPPEQRRSFECAAGVILDRLGLTDRDLRIEVFPDVPRGMGLGGSAAIAVAIIRALDRHFGLQLRDEQVNELAWLSEEIAHGSPSGIDNTLATYGRPLVYRRGTPPLAEPLNITRPLHLVVAMTREEGLTARTVGNVREARERNPRLYEKIFDDIDALVLQAVAALQDNDVATLGDLMNICQGLLNALQVSTPELERLIGIARGAGALGAKLTGGGGGGAIVALCDGDATGVQQAIERHGYRAIAFTAGGEP
ncbi:MAG: hydroxymethylglutaryl-CoA reductase, degradative [Gammaproteobacteria bacterium]|nr:hydroxymethylglutaryl-CoA reductase, degradative [Gammaproteobacteria bacterium]